MIAADVIARLLDEAEKAQRKGYLVLAEVCRDASDLIGLQAHALATAREVCGRNNCNCPGAPKVRAAVDALSP